jgi:hypothetical protein
MNREDHPHSLDPVTACEALVIVMAIIVITMFLTPGGIPMKIPLSQAPVANSGVKPELLACSQ